MSNCLPEGYDRVPSTGRYMKLLEGKNVFRALDRMVIGYWNMAGKPVRLRQRPSSRPGDIRTEDDGKENIKDFWAFPVWNYADKAVQILEITQATIQNAIKALDEEENWGDPTGYDIAASKSGSGFGTEYSVLGIPPKPLDPAIAADYAKSPVNLGALFENGDPFAPKPSAAEAIDGPGHEDPTITVDDAPMPAEPPPA
jgi:hypothetical protein